MNTLTSNNNKTEKQIKNMNTQTQNVTVHGSTPSRKERPRAVISPTGEGKGVARGGIGRTGSLLGGTGNTRSQGGAGSSGSVGGASSAGTGVSQFWDLLQNAGSLLAISCVNTTHTSHGDHVNRVGQ